MIRRWLVAVASVVLGASLCGCSSSPAKPTETQRSPNGTTAASPAEVASLLQVDGDKDNDVGAASDDPNNNSALDFGRPASRSERYAITSLVKRYFHVALVEQGAKACALLYSPLAEAAPEDFGSFAGPAYMRGKTCPEILTKQFKHFHALLAIEVPKLKVTRVRLEEHHGRAILSFGPRLPEREIQVQRESRTWRIAELRDGQLG